MVPVRIDNSGTMKEFHDPEELLMLMRHQTVLVSFVKKDGSFRKMRCTLEGFNAEKEGVVFYNPENTLFTVYNVDQKGWRRFFWGNILEVVTPQNDAIKLLNALARLG